MEEELPVYTFLLPLLLLWSCGQSENTRQIKDNHAVGLQLTAQSTVNYILIHGGGPNFIVRLDKLKRRLIQSGVKSEDIYMPTYNYKKPVEDIGVELGFKLKKIIESKPKNYNTFTRKLCGSLRSSYLRAFTKRSKIHRSGWCSTRTVKKPCLLQ
jgi:hypothetical protein